MKVTSKYFSEKEFRNCSPSCSLQDMNQVTMEMLDDARSIAGIPFVINSAYRSSYWDKSKGRSGIGAHTTGEAVDIRCNTDANRFKIIYALIRAGFTRIGVAKTYIHADSCMRLPQEVTWMY